MAEFSKQYCEKHLQEFEPDFDILEIAEGLENEYYTPIICEGFGFLAIGKNENGEVILAYRQGTGEPTDEIIWKTYNEVINE